MKLKAGVLPKHPYRDSALLYAGFAVVYLVIVGVTGGTVVPKIGAGSPFAIGALPIAVVCFVLATGYSWWRIRERLEAEEQES
jgi:hypothetical protein